MQRFKEVFNVLTRTTKLHGCATQQCDGKMMRLVYTICFKSLTNKDFYGFFLEIRGSLLDEEKQKHFVFNIPKTFMIETAP